MTEYERLMQEVVDLRDHYLAAAKSNPSLQVDIYDVTASISKIITKEERRTDANRRRAEKRMG